MVNIKNKVMKANAPERIWIDPATDLPKLSGHIDKDSVEYIRKDAFVEKLDKWLSLNLKMLMSVLDVEYNTHETDVKDFIKDFKNYMKGE
jgi:hypothetical protein